MRTFIVIMTIIFAICTITMYMLVSAHAQNGRWWSWSSTPLWPLYPCWPFWTLCWFWSSSCLDYTGNDLDHGDGAHEQDGRLFPPSFTPVPLTRHPAMTFLPQRRSVLAVAPPARCSCPPCPVLLVATPTLYMSLFLQQEEQKTTLHSEKSELAAQLSSFIECDILWTYSSLRVHFCMKKCWSFFWSVKCCILKSWPLFWVTLSNISQQ